MQKGWSHSESNPNFRSAGVGFERTRSKQTLHSISWLCFNASRCFCFFSHILRCSSFSSGLKGCKQRFPQLGHKSPWIWGHLSPRGQSPAAANEQIGRSAGLRLVGSPTSSSSRNSCWSRSCFHAGCLGRMKGLLEAESSVRATGTRATPLDDVQEGWGGYAGSETRDCWALVDEDEAEDWDWEGLTCWYLHRLP